MENTQTSTFQAIYRYTWLRNPDQSIMFWLIGLSGTGKSTVARTLAKSLFKPEQSHTVLGASFFFDTLELSRSKTAALIPTIAKSLASISQLPELGEHIAHVIQENDDIGSKGMS